jgi:hypothetical protein
MAAMVHAVLAFLLVVLGGNIIGYAWWLAVGQGAFWLGRELFFDTGGDNGAGWRFWRWTAMKHVEWLAPLAVGLAAAWWLGRG